MDFLQSILEIELAQAYLSLQDEELREKYAYLFIDIDFLTESEIRKKREALSEDDRAGKYNKLLELLGGSYTARILLHLILAALMEAGFADYIKDEYGAINIELAHRISEEELTYSQLKAIVRSAEEFFTRKIETPLAIRDPFEGDERLLDYFLEEESVDRRFERTGAELFIGSKVSENTQRATDADIHEKVYVGHKQLEQIKAALDKSSIRCIQVIGSKSCGKKFLIKRACNDAGKKVFFVDMSRIFLEKSAQWKGWARLILREAIFHDAGICFYHVEMPDGLENREYQKDLFTLEFVKTFLKPALNKNILCFVPTSVDTELVPLIDEYIETVEIPSYGRNERIALWTGFAQEYGLEDRIDLEIAGTKFKLTAGEIQKAVKRISITREGQAIDESCISHICEEVLYSPDSGSITRVNNTYTIDDLKLPAEQKNVLNNICAHVWHRHQVYDIWNLESRYSYGKNISALFCGAPGTGKTMAVHVLASMLQLPLYRIDLSQVVDKYIGETEKKLEEIFNLAEKNNSILFFDEADSVFGKRSEVNEAKDKYANTEVSYILQRIEVYDGIVILATNYRKNIDEAFMRRIRYVVEFPMPSKEVRKELWMSCFAKETELGNIDFDYLAEQFEVAGGAIKNIVLNAAFLAASEQSPVQMWHILSSVRVENFKMGKVMLPSDFGVYAGMMEEMSIG